MSVDSISDGRAQLIYQFKKQINLEKWQLALGDYDSMR